MNFLILIEFLNFNFVFIIFAMDGGRRDFFVVIIPAIDGEKREFFVVNNFAIDHTSVLR